MPCQKDVLIMTTVIPFDLSRCNLVNWMDFFSTVEIKDRYSKLYRMSGFFKLRNYVRYVPHLNFLCICLPSFVCLNCFSLLLFYLFVKCILHLSLQCVTVLFISLVHKKIYVIYIKVCLLGPRLVFFSARYGENGHYLNEVVQNSSKIGANQVEGIL